MILRLKTPKTRLLITSMVTCGSKCIDLPVMPSALRKTCCNQNCWVTNKLHLIRCREDRLNDFKGSAYVAHALAEFEKDVELGLQKIRAQPKVRLKQVARVLHTGELRGPQTLNSDIQKWYTWALLLYTTQDR